MFLEQYAFLHIFPLLPLPHLASCHYHVTQSGLAMCLFPIQTGQVFVKLIGIFIAPADDADLLLPRCAAPYSSAGA